MKHPLHLSHGHQVVYVPLSDGAYLVGVRGFGLLIVPKSALTPELLGQLQNATQHHHLDIPLSDGSHLVGVRGCGLVRLKRNQRFTQETS